MIFLLGFLQSCSNAQSSYWYFWCVQNLLFITTGLSCKFSCALLFIAMHSVTGHSWLVRILHFYAVIILFHFHSGHSVSQGYPDSPAAGPVTQDQISRMLAVSPITLADKCWSHTKSRLLCRNRSKGQNNCLFLLGGTVSSLPQPQLISVFVRILPNQFTNAHPQN